MFELYYRRYPKYLYAGFVDFWMPAIQPTKIPGFMVQTWRVSFLNDFDFLSRHGTLRNAACRLGLDFQNGMATRVFVCACVLAKIAPLRKTQFLLVSWRSKCKSEFPCA